MTSGETHETGAPLLEVRGIGKRFGAVEALRCVDLSVRRGEILGLLGDNGAGKSTLIKILNGVHQPDRGEMRWAGAPMVFRSPRDAYAQGVATVFQDLAVIDLMSVSRNLFLGRERAITRGVWPLRWLDHAAARRETRTALAKLGINIRSADQLVLGMSGGERQSIAVARAVQFSAKLLILDEPVSALSLRQTDQVFDAVRRAREEGLAVILISHNVRQMHEIADRFIVLSHGESVADLSPTECSADEVSDLILKGHQAANGV